MTVDEYKKWLATSQIAQAMQVYFQMNIDAENTRGLAMGIDLNDPSKDTPEMIQWRAAQTVLRDLQHDFLDASNFVDFINKVG